MSEIRDEMYLQLHGYKPIKRARPKEGKSKWYYLDPRGTDNVSEMGQIDVVNEYVPNPKIIKIVKDDMRRHEEDYYIWRTEGDDKVRDAHAARDGHIYNWHIPPVGGHPGKDYNCRCWAEPFEFKEDDSHSIVLDVSGLDRLAVAVQSTFINENSPIIIEDYAHRRYIFESLEEEKLLKRIGKQIVTRENFIYYAYLDSSGYITTGNGALVNDLKDFQKVHWVYNGKPATKEEIEAEFERMQELQKRITEDAKEYAKEHNIPFVNPFQKITADRYKESHVLEITRDEADYLMYSHLHKDYINLKRYLPELDNAPEAAQDVAFDIQYNPGITSSTWTYFKKYFNEKNVEELAKQVHRKGISESRNNEMRDKILSIKRW